MTKAGKDAALIYQFGKAYHELKDNPFFQTYQRMLQTIVDSLQNSVCGDDPANAHELDFRTILTHRAGQVFGLKHLQLVQEQYHTNFMNTENQEEDDEEEVSQKPGRRSATGTSGKRRAR